MRRSIHFVLGACLVCFIAPAAQAVPITFDVDLFANHPTTTHELKVFGELTIDPDAPIASSIISSSLFFQHTTDSGPDDVIPFASMPTANPGGTNLDFVYLAPDMYLQTSGAGNDSLYWEADGLNGSAGFTFNSGPMNEGVEIYYFDFGEAINESIIIPAGPNGTLLSTPIPEPASTILLAAGVGMIALRRRRSV